MDLILRNARLAARDPGTLFDIGIAGGRIAAIAPRLDATGPAHDVGGRLVVPGFVETHIHLDKSGIVDRCACRHGTLDEAIAEVSREKRAFTVQDVLDRARRTLEKCIGQGTMHVRTHVEVDPAIGLRGFEAVLQLAEAYRWAVDIETCVFAQEGLTNYPGTEELMREALAKGARVVGGAPYTDSDPHAQIDRIFAMARDFDVDVDFHLDLGNSAEYMDLGYVCEATERHGWQGRVAVGHVTKMSLLPPPDFDRLATRVREAGVAVTVLPSTDLYLMGRGERHTAVRGVLAVHELLSRGANGSIATNNVMNPFTPYGDCSLVRMANLYANVCHVARAEDLAECLAMVTTRAANLMRLPDYGVEEGKAADLVVLDAQSPARAIAEIAPPLWGFKRGRRSFSREPVRLHRP
jgi:cytosine deaminase